MAVVLRKNDGFEFLDIENMKAILFLIPCDNIRVFVLKELVELSDECVRSLFHGVVERGCGCLPLRQF